MSLLIREVVLRVVTPKGTYGSTFSLDRGLVVIRADNSAGKSTCVQAIVYALGLERMLGATSDIPLPHVMTKYIQDGKESFHVLQSEVLLEIENSHGERLTIRRAVAGGEDTRLITTWEGGKLTSPDAAYVQKDYFTRDPGAATHEAGFHHRFAAFLGWDLPTVARFNGTECLLYLECIFPLFIVEQKRGWAGIQTNLPSYLGIKEMGKRALEFVLGLEAAGLAEARQRLKQLRERLRTQWSAARAAQSAALQILNCRTSGVPARPAASWPPTVAPQLTVFRDGTWIGLSEARRSDREELQRRSAEPVVVAEAASESLRTELTDARQKLEAIEFQSEAILDDIYAEDQTRTGVETRLTALRDDLQRNTDELKLKRLGSVAALQVSQRSCPTCRQEITDALLGTGVATHAMTVEDNIVYLHSQIQTFEALQANSQSVIEKKRAELAVVQEAMGSLRARMRAIRQTLIAPSGSPSVEDVRKRLELELRLENYQKAEDVFNVQMEQFAKLADEWASNEEEIRRLPDEELSASDKEKLELLTQSVRAQLNEYGFTSVVVNSVKLSPDTYRPVSTDGFDLGFDASASDNIRLIWAFVTGLLELARVKTMNHLGLLIFDEPRQQATQKVSFDKFLERLHECRAHAQQVLFFTSEPASVIEPLCDAGRAQLITIDGRIIKRLA